MHICWVLSPQPSQALESLLDCPHQSGDPKTCVMSCCVPFSAPKKYGRELTGPSSNSIKEHRSHTMRQRTSRKAATLARGDSKLDSWSLPRKSSGQHGALLDFHLEGPLRRLGSCADGGKQAVRLVHATYAVGKLQPCCANSAPGGTPNSQYTPKGTCHPAMPSRDARPLKDCFLVNGDLPCVSS